MLTDTRRQQLAEHATRGNPLSPAQAQELLGEVERLRGQVAGWAHLAGVAMGALMRHKAQLDEHLVALSEARERLEAG